MHRHPAPPKHPGDVRGTGSVEGTLSATLPWVTVDQASTPVPSRVSGTLGHKRDMVLLKW